MAKVKICGLKTAAALEAAVEAGADYIGLVHFSPSPRHVSLDRAAELASIGRGEVKIVLLLVGPDDRLVMEATEIVEPDFIQLHGDENPQRAAKIAAISAIPIIKALKIENRGDIGRARDYQDSAAMVLFDARPPAGAELPGGNGIPFDWRLVEGFEWPGGDYLLSGGLDPDNVAEAIRLTGAPIVDVSSGVEMSRGVKDVEKIRRFIAAARQA